MIGERTLARFVRRDLDHFGLLIVDETELFHRGRRPLH
jgi:hypothetical protein